MLPFFIGLWLGALVGVTAMCILEISSRGDD
ncbi:MAG: DUF3789 domain-containing protein [Clostridia bacterium]|nr:DUF3789 domain-containing protein [Clostridia bacterium]